MGNGPGGIVILRGGAVPPNSGAVPPPLYITIRGNGPGAVPPGPFPMDKLDGPSGILKILNPIQRETYQAYIIPPLKLI